jgi:hypothetical protein
MLLLFMLELLYLLLLLLFCWWFWVWISEAFGQAALGASPAGRLLGANLGRQRTSLRLLLLLLLLLCLVLRCRLRGVSEQAIQHAWRVLLLRLLLLRGYTASANNVAVPTSTVKEHVRVFLVRDSSWL